MHRGTGNPNLCSDMLLGREGPKVCSPIKGQSTILFNLPNTEGRLAAALFSGPEPPPCMDAAIPPSRAHFTYRRVLNLATASRFATNPLGGCYHESYTHNQPIVEKARHGRLQQRDRQRLHKLLAGLGRYLTFARTHGPSADPHSAMVVYTDPNDIKYLVAWYVHGTTDTAQP
jgi:hypothetical protein